ncbi:MSHA biogenesis protein MshA [Pseudoalteromonas ruthenica]|nr:MSHA biogenesis protein MshA [Pseudoalteromonas ruthenica]
MKATKQQGFTLIELIIVIVILGILAVTAAPRFLNLQGDANAATVQGVKGAMNSAKDIVYGKAIIEGLQDDAGDGNIGVDLGTDGSVDVTTSFGYPQAAATGIAAAMDIDLANDFASNVIAATGGTPAIFVVRADGSAEPTAVVAGNGTGGEANDGCYVAYTEAADANTPPVITLNLDDCQ